MVRVQEFNYLTFLRELEREVAAAAKLKLPADRDGIQRARQWFGGRFAGGLIAFATGELARGERRIANRLYIRADEMRKAEQASLKSIRRLTEIQDGYEFDQPPSWPPVVPLDQVLSRFVGHAIGLHSENPDKELAGHVADSFRETVIPALAWGLVSQLAWSAEERAPMIAAIERTLAGKPDAPASDLRYLRLTTGFLNTLGLRSAEWRLTEPTLGELREALRSTFSTLANDPTGAFPSALSQHYGPRRAGSDRAHAVALAQRRAHQSAAFLRERIELLSSARSAELAAFRRLCATDLRAACQDAQTWLATDASQEVADRGRLAAGRAYWLARETFGKHDPGAAEALTRLVEYRDEKGQLRETRQADVAPHELDAVEWASKLTLQLLREAARAYRGQDELRATCLRFAAGYATNPRYHRATSVLALQTTIVEEYAREPKARARLTDMFRARIAWQSQATVLPLKNQSELKEAARLYQAAVAEDGAPQEALDAEAPVQLFPEVLAFLETYHDESKGGEKLLRVVDYVVQQNYGVYFDVVTERQLLADGLTQFKRWHGNLEQELTKRNSEIAQRLLKAKEDGKPTARIILQYCMETLGRIEYGYAAPRGERAKSA